MRRERWKPIPRFRGYFVSDRGRVLGQKGKILRPGWNTPGYLFVTLCNTRRQQMVGIHQLVARAFVSGYRRGFEVNHKNGNKRRNAWTNLQSRSGNQRHAADIGLKPCGARSHLCIKLTPRSVRRIRALAGTMSQSKIGALFGVAQTYVGKIINRKKWRQLQ